MEAHTLGRIIYIDGPEKSGKSTLIATLKPKLEDLGYDVSVRHWGQVTPDDRVYAPAIEEDLLTRADHITIWDRGWVAEHVYGMMLNRHRRGATNPWLMEWLHGRALVGNGLRIIVLPRDTRESADRRDETDLPVNPTAEYNAFLNYAEEFDYDVYWNAFEPDWLHLAADDIAFNLPDEKGCNPRYYTHSLLWPAPPNLVIGEARNKNDRATMAGAWLPFTSARMCSFVQKYFKNDAFRFAWTNVEEFTAGRLHPNLIRGASEVFTFGEAARVYVDAMGIEPKAAFSHPAFFSRWNTERGREARRKFETGYRAAFDISE